MVTRCRSESTGSPFWSPDGDRRLPSRARRAARAASDDRRGLPAAAGRISGHLDLEDPLPRRPGPAGAAAHAGRIPPFHGGRRRPAADDPPPAARRVPTPPGDSPGVGRSAAQVAAPLGARRTGAGARPRRTLRAHRGAGLLRPRPRGLRPARPARRGRGAALSGTRRRRRLRLPRACPLRDRAAEPEAIQDGCRAGGGEARANRGAEAPLAQPGSPPRGPRRPAGACRAFAGALPAALLASRALAGSLGAVPVDLSSKIRDIPDFPKRGIVFKDIMPLLADPEALHQTVEELAEFAEPRKPDLILGAEARGFILGAALAYRLGCGFVAARKPGKLPWRTVSAKYALEYGFDALELHADAIKGGARVLIHDDLLATGGTARAKVDLVEQLGGEVVGLAFVIELEFLEGREKLDGYDVFSLIKY